MTSTTPETRPSEKAQAKREPRTEQPRRWHVVLLDDDEHSYDYVIRMMRELFAMGEARALKAAKTVDKEGRVICLTTHKEHAELKRDQIHAFGRDPLIMQCKGAMSAIIEPADFGEDDSDNQSRPPQDDGR